MPEGEGKEDKEAFFGIVVDLTRRARNGGSDSERKERCYMRTAAETSGDAERKTARKRKWERKKKKRKHQGRMAIHSHRLL